MVGAATSPVYSNKEGVNEFSLTNGERKQKGETIISDSSMQLAIDISWNGERIATA